MQKTRVMVFQITYDINKNVNDYSKFYDAIKSIGSSYRQPLESSWFISCSSTDINSNKIVELLKPYLFKSDHLFVCSLNKDLSIQGWLGSSFWNWLKEEL